MPKPYTVVLGVTANQNNEVLVAKVRPNRVSDFHGLHYVTPGGVVEPGETLEQALERELLNESGGKVPIIIGPQIHTRIDPHTDETVVYFWFTFGTYVSMAGPVLDTSLSKTTEQLMWVPIRDLPRYGTHSDPIVRSILESRLLVKQ
jgi:8-oxo-dGTP pyrophosphatase MutT (NUDIX family)